MKKEDLSYQTIKSATEKAGFKFFTGPYNLNMTGIRSKNRAVNNWDDFFALTWEDENDEKKIWVNDQFTTDPGIYYMQKKLLNPEGCGILARGQYRGVWTLGMHFSYEAFIQTGCKVGAYRDRNRDNIMDFDPKTLKYGYYGCDQHHGYDTKNVDNNSAMCQVHRYKKDLEYVKTMARKNIAMGWGKSFTYTLLEEEIDF